MIIDYVESHRNQVSGSTLSQVRDALKHFYEMNNFENGINWAKITKMMPRARKIGSDRAPTMEEIRKIADNADLRSASFSCSVPVETSNLSSRPAKSSRQV